MAVAVGEAVEVGVLGEKHISWRRIELRTQVNEAARSAYVSRTLLL